MKRMGLSLVTLALTACNLGGGTGSDFSSGGSSSSSSSSGGNADPGGIWTGVDSASGLDVVAIVEESGTSEYLRNGVEGLRLLLNAMRTGAIISCK